MDLREWKVGLLQVNAAPRHGSRRPSHSVATGGNPTTCVRAFVPHVSTALATSHHQAKHAPSFSRELVLTHPLYTWKPARLSPRAYACSRPALPKKLPHLHVYLMRAQPVHDGAAGRQKHILRQ